MLVKFNFFYKDQEIEFKFYQTFYGKDMQKCPLFLIPMMNKPLLKEM